MVKVDGNYKRTMYMHGSGKTGKYIKMNMIHRGQFGTGIVETLGKAGTKAVLGSLGKNVGSYGGKQLAKFIQDKTGSKLLGNVAKAALGSVGAFAGSKLGNVTGRVLANTVFKEPEKKKENKTEKVSLSELMDRARAKLLNPTQSGTGISIIR